MGGSGSSNRKVSFELDEQERVRVLQGIRLSQDVVNRMKEPSKPERDQRSPPLRPPPTSKAAEGHPKTSAGIPPRTGDSLDQKPSEAEEDLYRRYEQEQALAQEELLQLAKKEREAARESLKLTMQRERNRTTEEKQKTAQLPADLDALTQELQWKEEELKRKENFYRKQQARIEKKNSELYKLTLDQYTEAVAKAEDQIRRRNTQPICANLQEAILTCYNENKTEVLNCSELVKEYQRCVRLAQKELLVHFD